MHLGEIIQVRSVIGKAKAIVIKKALMYVFPLLQFGSHSRHHRSRRHPRRRNGAHPDGRGVPGPANQRHWPDHRPGLVHVGFFLHYTLHSIHSFHSSARDRLQTTVTVMGDAFGAGIVHHFVNALLSTEERDMDKLVEAARQLEEAQNTQTEQQAEEEEEEQKEEEEEKAEQPAEERVARRNPPHQQQELDSGIDVECGSY
jgi:hypothetical protein